MLDNYYDKIANESDGG
ncbi:Protein of unknown function [Pyronema omphalodes CBS 100304]|uniref:Uncharacterized protein n=1 Tax=Pyronema omphalodes (strain CBS 100304) TaxID=1076935 RepID=U4L8I8_PYROM|nr:Protein of unknown function [Pyronema omphalodes CBS 100304]